MSASNGPAWADPQAHQAPNHQQDTISVEQHQLELFRPYSTLDEPVSETIMRDVRAVAKKLQIVLTPLDRNPAYKMTYAVLSQISTDNSNAAATEATTTTTTTTETDTESAEATTTESNNNSSVPATEDADDNQTLSENDRKVITELKDWDLWGPLLLCLSLGVILSFRAPSHQASLVFAAVFCTVWVGGTVVTVNAQLLGSSISFFQSLCVIGYSIFPLTLAALAIGTIHIVINLWVWIDIIIVAVGFLWASRVSSVFMSLYVKPERRFLALYPVFFFYVFLSWLIVLF